MVRSRPRMSHRRGNTMHIGRATTLTLMLGGLLACGHARPPVAPAAAVAAIPPTTPEATKPGHELIERVVVFPDGTVRVQRLMSPGLVASIPDDELLEARSSMVAVSDRGLERNVAERSPDHRFGTMGLENTWMDLDMPGVAQSLMLLEGQSVCLLTKEQPRPAGGLSPACAQPRNVLQVHFPEPYVLDEVLKARGQSRDARSYGDPFISLAPTPAQSPGKGAREKISLKNVANLRAVDAHVQQQLSQLVAANHEGVRKRIGATVASLPTGTAMLWYSLPREAPRYTIRVLSTPAEGNVTREVTLTNTTSVPWPAGSSVSFFGSDDWERCRMTGRRSGERAPNPACEVVLMEFLAPGEVRALDASQDGEAHIPTYPVAPRDHSNGEWDVCVSEEGAKRSLWGTPWRIETHWHSSAVRDFANEPLYSARSSETEVTNKLSVYWPVATKSPFESSWASKERWRRWGGAPGFGVSSFWVTTTTLRHEDIAFSNVLAGRRYLLDGKRPHQLSRHLGLQTKSCANSDRLLFIAPAEPLLQSNGTDEHWSGYDDSSALREYALSAKLDRQERDEIMKASCLLERLERHYLELTKHVYIDQNGASREARDVPVMNAKTRREFDAGFAEVRKLLAPWITSRPPEPEPEWP